MCRDHSRRTVAPVVILTIAAISYLEAPHRVVGHRVTIIQIIIIIIPAYITPRPVGRVSDENRTAGELEGYVLD